MLFESVVDMDNQIAYVTVEEHVEGEIKYTFRYNLKECSSRNRLFKYRKTDIEKWYAELPDIIRKELNADTYIIVFYGSDKGYQLLKSLPKTDKIQVVSERDFDRGEMLRYLVSQGNQKAIDELHTDNDSSRDSEMESCGENRKDPDEIRHEAEGTEFDAIIFEQLSQMDADDFVLRISSATRKTLAGMVFDYLEQHNLAECVNACVYLQKINQPRSAYKYIGILLFFDRDGVMLMDSDGEAAGCRFVCLCISGEMEDALEQNGDGIIVTISLE